MEESTTTRASAHPDDMSEFTPHKRFCVPPHDLQITLAYGHLTDKTPFAEYAWEFLRRNRYYQQRIDGTGKLPDVAQWGYSPSPSEPAGIPLRREKPYYELYSEGTPPIWTAVERLQARFHDNVKHCTTPNHKSRITFELDHDQVALAFDTAEFFGTGQLALEQQAELALKYLREYVTARLVKWKGMDRQGEYEPPGARSQNRPNRAVLRSFLAAADSIPGKKAIDKQKTVAERSADTKNASEHRQHAHAYIYQWKCLTLLKWDLKIGESRPLRKRKDKDALMQWQKMK